MQPDVDGDKPGALTGVWNTIASKLGMGEMNEMEIEEYEIWNKKRL